MKSTHVYRKKVSLQHNGWKLYHKIHTYTHKNKHISLTFRDVIEKRTSNKVALIKFIFDDWQNEIVPTLSKVHDTRWPGFDGEKIVKTMLFSVQTSSGEIIYTVSGKKRTSNILGITLTKFNKFSQFLAQFMLTCQLTNNYVSLTSSKCRFHEKINTCPVRCRKTADWIWMPFGVVGRLGPRMRQSDGIGTCPTRRCTKHASLISTTSNIPSEMSGPSSITPSLLQLCVSGIDVLQLVWRLAVVISSTAFNSDIWRVVGWYSSLIFCSCQLWRCAF